MLLSSPKGRHDDENRYYQSVILHNRLTKKKTSEHFMSEAYKYVHRYQSKIAITKMSKYSQ